MTQLLFLFKYELRYLMGVPSPHMLNSDDVTEPWFLLKFIFTTTRDIYKTIHTSQIYSQVSLHFDQVK